MIKEDLWVIGQCLWGSEWQTTMAEFLYVSPRSIRRWARGQAIPGPAVCALTLILAHMQDDLNSAGEALLEEITNGPYDPNDLMGIGLSLALAFNDPERRKLACRLFRYPSQFFHGYDPGIGEPIPAATEI